MLKLTIPGTGTIAIKHLVFDVNGTLAVDGEISDQVVKKVQQLRTQLQVHLLTADTHGKQKLIDKKLGFEAIRVQPGSESEQKAKYIAALGPGSVAAFGNGANDVLMLKNAGLGIAIIGPEGANRDAIAAADIVTTNIEDALQLLLNPKRIIAVLRK